MATPRILVVDDDRNLARALAILLEEEGWETKTAHDAGSAAALLADYQPDLVITDLRLPDHDGIWLIGEAKSRAPETRVIVITAFGTVERAVAAMQQGALDFLTKPLNNDELKLKVNRALELAALRRENTELRSELTARSGVANIIGHNPRFRDVLRLVLRVAPTDATVLIRGASGTGKELIARALHAHSRRATGPFIAVSCAALAPTLLESELFGHEKGAFTGAVSAKPGRFELAHGGTLFLDEIGDLDAGLQVKLLRVLEERRFERVGGTRTVEVDVRLVAATNRDLEELIRANRFRPDLYYRLNVVTVTLPTLAERRDDIPALAEHFLARYGAAHDRPGRRLSAAALDLLVHYDWPGNIRELENAIEFALIASDREVIEPADLPTALRTLTSTAAGTLTGAVEELERSRIYQALVAANWNQLAAARALGIQRGALQYKIRKYGLVKPTGPTSGR